MNVAALRTRAARPSRAAASRARRSRYVLGTRELLDPARR